MRTDIEYLCVRIPGLPVAVISHGEEQFALIADKQATEPGLHTIVENLATGKDVDLHGCRTCAGWFAVAPPEGFPDYVDVATAGPVQINDHRAPGSAHIVLP